MTGTSLGPVAGEPLTVAAIGEVIHGRSPLGDRHHVPWTRVFSATLSSSASANSLFIWAFSCSNSRNRLASDISMSPYFDFR